MSDGISGIKTIKPTYPVKPAQQTPQDRQSDERKKDSPSQSPHIEDDVEDNSGIDEYV